MNRSAAMGHDPKLARKKWITRVPRINIHILVEPWLG